MRCIFGFLGTIMLIVGFGFTIYLGTNKLYFNQIRLISQRPEFYIALKTMVMGAQFIAGFIGEILISNSKEVKRYNISEKANEKKIGV